MTTAKIGLKNLATEETLKALVTAAGAGATSEGLTDGSQKSQVVDSEGDNIPFATSTKQSDGSQKTQIVDGSGNVAGVTNNAQDVNIKGLIIPSVVSGTIDVASVLHVPNSSGRSLSYGVATVQMLSSNINKTTAFYLEFSVDGASWDNAVENGTDVEDTLVVNVPKVFPFEAPFGLYWRIRFASGSTGDVAYKIIG